MAFEKTYELKETIQEQAIKYFFISNGNKNIIKAIEYRYVQNFEEYPLFNLGFGDYDIQTDITSDQVMSNNGDAYTVFHTVLSTIPLFFEVRPNAVMMVQGSDSDTKFAENCKKSCRKTCMENCKNINRRINAYRWYVDKNFVDLSKTYIFYGGIKQATGILTLEKYCIGKIYDSVFVRKAKYICI